MGPAAHHYLDPVNATLEWILGEIPSQLVLTEPTDEIRLRLVRHIHRESVGDRDRSTTVEYPIEASSGDTSARSRDKRPESGWRQTGIWGRERSRSACAGFHADDSGYDWTSCAQHRKKIQHPTLLGMLLITPNLR